MPSSTPKQARFMAAAAHNPDFAAKAGIPVSVAKEFNQADQVNRQRSSALATYLRGRKFGSTPQPVDPLSY